MDAAEPLVKIERKERWAEVVLNRPQRRNALTGSMVEQLTSALRALAPDDSVEATVFRGEGGAFCSGHDLKELQADPPPSLGRIARQDLP